MEDGEEARASGRPEERRRQIGTDITLKRHASELMRPLRAALGEWQPQVVYLLTLRERRRLAGQATTEIDVKIGTLARTIEARRAQLETELRKLPPELAGHGRVLDVVRAIDHLLGRMDGEPPSTS